MFLYLLSPNPEFKTEKCILSFKHIKRLYLLLYAFMIVTVLHLGFKAKESFQVVLLLITLLPPYYIYLSLMSSQVHSLLNRDEWFQNEKDFIKEDPQCKIISEVMHSGVALDEHLISMDYISISILHVLVNGAVVLVGR